MGQTYLERGQPVAVLIRWETRRPAAASVIWHRPPRRNGPRNVLIERDDGSLVVRPFRGLRRPWAGSAPALGTQRDR
jgi:acetyl esterase